MLLKVVIFGSGDCSLQDLSIINGGGCDLLSVDVGMLCCIDGMILFVECFVKVGDENFWLQVQGVQDWFEQMCLYDLQIKLMVVIEVNLMLCQFKQQICIDLMLMGLCIEIVDMQKWLMFVMLSDCVELYMCDILCEIGKMLNDVLNWIIVQGYIDVVLYVGGEGGYSNWELLVDCVNVLCCELIFGGMDEVKVLCVLGFVLMQNLNKVDLFDLENCWISVIVLNCKFEEVLMCDDVMMMMLFVDVVGLKLFVQQFGGLMLVVCLVVVSVVVVVLKF